MKRKRLRAGWRAKLLGSNFSDYLIGGKNNDQLLGGSGSDIFDGRDGSDVLTGGRGADYFVISNGDDVVTDFNPNEGDRIVHSAHDNVVGFSLNGGTLLATKRSNVNTFIKGISPNKVFIYSQQRLKPAFEVVFKNIHV